MRYPNLEIDLLRAFAAVAESGSFTAAADIVGRSQSAVSQKVLRLEDLLGRRLFDRTSRMVNLTRDGEALLTSARRMLEYNDTVMHGLLQPPAAGSLRLGLAEDFVPGQLPKLLTRFGRLHADVQINLTVGLSCDLMAAYESNQLDAVIAKRHGSTPRGRVIWREPLLWMAASDYELDLSEPTRLVTRRPPCIYHEVMVSSLDALGRDWVAACTANSLLNVQAAVAGGFGVTVLGRSFMQPGLQILRTPNHWPALPMTEVTVVGDEADKASLVHTLLMFLTESLAAAPLTRVA